MTDAIGGATRPRDTRIEAIGIGIPARDEASTIGACVRSIGVAASMCGLPVSIAVAADRCADDTAQVVRRAALELPPTAVVTVLDVDRGTAGGARDEACRAALQALEHPAASIWVATTDADSTVPAEWLCAQLRWAAQGFQGVAGLVSVDHDADPELRLRAGRHLAGLGTGHGHPHVHGANLGVRADVWESAGGFRHVEVGEDQALWHDLRRRGANLVAVTDGVVSTSGRLVGRAPQGFAADLAALAGAAAMP